MERLVRKCFVVGIRIGSTPHELDLAFPNVVSSGWSQHSRLRNFQYLNTSEPILEQRSADDVIDETQRRRFGPNANPRRTAIEQGGEHPTDDTFDFCRVSVNDGEFLFLGSWFLFLGSWFLVLG